MSQGSKNRTKKSQKKKYNVVICAHPDDETIFFGGLIQKYKTHPWLVACATDGNADGMGAKRAEDFKKACRQLGVAETVMFGFPDVFNQRLNIEALQEKIAELPEAFAIYTHGPVGEYGHPHHQDVGLATFQFYNKQRPQRPTYGVAYNCSPEVLVALSDEQFAKKAQILSQIYGSETQRFQNILPCTFSEGFCRFTLKEIESLYAYYTQKKVPQKNDLIKYRWLLPFLEMHKDEPTGPRLF
ncbi:MAG: PIG-L family deacetylase [Bdellovibrionota bacterium]